MAARQSASHCSHSLLRSLRWLGVSGVLALVFVVQHQGAGLSEISAEICAEHGETCKYLDHLTHNGVRACTSPPLDFKRFAATQAKSAARAAIVPQGAFDTLHSRPGATRVIYLDFDGHVTQNTPWNSAGPITTTAFDADGNPATFNAGEQATITEIWSRISECYSPFDIDVTTEAPTVADLINTGNGDKNWGVRVLFGDSEPSPAPGAGGVAYIDVYGGVNWGTAPDDIPCFVLQDGMGTGAKGNADAAVHEVGHTLGLGHDGLTTPVTTYYSGHGSGKVGWAPHMGVGYYVPIVQFSKGEYLNANNFQDDLQIISKARNGFGYRADDFASTQSSAKNIPGAGTATTFNVNVSGVIETTNDTDWFKILCGSGNLKLNAVGGPTNTMLDIELTLYDSKGNVITTVNPVDDVIASINQFVQGGTYYLKIDGVGVGDPLATGYTEYASLGQYTITGSFSIKGIKGAPQLTGPSTLFYGVKQQPIPINANIKVADVDNTTLESATVKISKNFVANQDRLVFTRVASTMGNIVGSYDTTTATMTLTSAGATATVPQFQNALRAVTYSNTSSNPANKPRTIDFQAYDGSITSNILSSTVTIGYFYVTAAYNAATKTLTITDDTNSNSIAIVQRGNLIAVEGAGATRIGTSASNTQSVTFPYSGDIKIVVNCTGGNDTVSLVGVKSSTTTITLGAGNDAVTLTYCNISTKLTVNGNSGTDSVKLIGSTVAAKNYISVP